MAVPYPGDGSTGYGQDADHRISMAGRVILDAIDEQPNWQTITSRLTSRLGADPDDATDRSRVQNALLIAELDLEWDNAVVYEKDHFRRPTGDHDPVPVPPERLSEVAEAVWLLGWPNPGHKPSRTIHECFLALHGRYRHCDVYWAMHKYLKGTRLRLVRANWMLQADVGAVLADLAHDAIELERELEAQLVEQYVVWLGRSDVRKYRFGNGREADLYDRKRRLIIEAKADCFDDVTVAHGMGQAMYYRALHDLTADNKIAVLLPGKPREEAARLLRIYDVGLIYRAGDTFVEEIR